MGALAPSAAYIPLPFAAAPKISIPAGLFVPGTSTFTVPLGTPSCIYYLHAAMSVNVKIPPPPTTAIALLYNGTTILSSSGSTLTGAAGPLFATLNTSTLQVLNAGDTVQVVYTATSGTLRAPPVTGDPTTYFEAYCIHPL